MNLYTIQNILVPIDLSETSLNALQTAVALAKIHGATIHLLHVDETLPGYNDNQTDSLLSSEINKDVLTALAGTVRQNAGMLPAVHEEAGHVSDRILKTAAQTQCDLIVMGTHGASGFRDGFIGSNTYSVFKYASCPVLSIPPKRKFSSFKKVLFPIKPISGAFLPYHVASHFLAANSLVDVLGLSYLNIERETDVLDKIVEEFSDRWDDKKITIRTSWSQGASVAFDILQFAQQNMPDLIVLTSVLDALPKSNFVGPNAQKVIHGSRVPVLQIKKVGVLAATKVA